jgi:hypothetical protein
VLLSNILIKRFVYRLIEYKIVFKNMSKNMVFDRKLIKLDISLIYIVILWPNATVAKRR